MLSVLKVQFYSRQDVSNKNGGKKINAIVTTFFRQSITSMTLCVTYIFKVTHKIVYIPQSVIIRV